MRGPAAGSAKDSARTGSQGVQESAKEGVELEFCAMPPGVAYSFFSRVYGSLSVFVFRFQSVRPFRSSYQCASLQVVSYGARAR